MIRAAGAKTPAEMIAAGEWNWDNAIATAAKVAATGKQGLIIRDFEYKAWENLAEVYTGWNAYPWSKDTKSCAFASPEMVDAMRFIHDAIFVKKAMPGPGVSADFFAGDAAMTTTQISRAALLPKGDKAFDWDLVPLPKGPAGDYAVTGRAGIGVMASGKTRSSRRNSWRFSPPSLMLPSSRGFSHRHGRACSPPMSSRPPTHCCRVNR